MGCLHRRDKVARYMIANERDAAVSGWNGPELMGQIVESPGGLSPPGAPRSVREPLGSYGSRWSAVSMTELPVGEECWIYSA